MARAVLCAASLLSAQALDPGSAVGLRGQVPEVDFRGQDTARVTEPVKTCTDRTLPQPRRLYSTHRLLLLPLPELRTGVDVEPVSWQDLSVRVTYELEGACAWLKTWSSFRSSAASSGADQAFAVFCEDCRYQPCKRKASQELGWSWSWAGGFWRTAGDGLFVQLPPAGGCVHIDSVPVFGSSVKRLSGALLRWEEHADVLVLPWAAIGMALVIFALPLSQSTLVHALIGFALGFAVIAFALCWWMLRTVKEAAERPFAALSLAVLPALLALAQLAAGPQWRDILEWRVNNLPVGWMIVGVLCVVAAGCVLCGAIMGRRFLASPPEPLGAVPFAIGSDGRRIDEVPPVPLQQQLLCWVLWASGVLMIASCTHHPPASLLMAVLAVLQETLAHWLSASFMSYQASDPGHFRHLLQRRSYEEQGEKHTAAALGALARHIRANEDVLGRLSEASERHVRRFSNGAEHIIKPLLKDTGSRWNCAVL